MTHRIDSCRFRRGESSEWEPGLIINYGDESQRLVDAEGREPVEVWDCRLVPELAVDFAKGDIWLPIFRNWLDEMERKLGEGVRGGWHGKAS